MFPSFTNPGALLLLLAIPPLVTWQIKQRPFRILSFPGVTTLQDIASWRTFLGQWGAIGLRLAGLTLLGIALAGPRWPDLHTRLDTEGIAIEVVVDVSGSMAEVDYEWDGDRIARLEAVRRAFLLFVQGGPAQVDGQELTFEGRPTDQIGLITFATRPTVVCPLTLSHSVLINRLNEEEPRQTPTESETNISDALALGLQRLNTGSAQRKVILLFTDGEHNVPAPLSGWTVREVGPIARSLGIPIYVIDGSGSRSEPGTDASRNRTRAHKILEELASMTGGNVYSARDRAGLLLACHAFDRLERTNIQSFQYRRYHEGYPWFALASLLCWLVILFLETTWLRKIP